MSMNTLQMYDTYVTNHSVCLYSGTKEPLMCISGTSSVCYLFSCLLRLYLQYTFRLAYDSLLFLLGNIYFISPVQSDSTTNDSGCPTSRFKNFLTPFVRSVFRVILTSGIPLCFEPCDSLSFVQSRRRYITHSSPHRQTLSLSSFPVWHVAGILGFPTELEKEIQIVFQ